MNRLVSDELLRYRVMAYAVGVMLILVFIGLIPAINSMDAVLGPIHGVLYLAYLATALQLLIRYRLGLWTFIGMVVAGWCPFVAFIMERRVTAALALAASPG